MIKIQKKDFNIEEEIVNIKSKHLDIGAVSTFIGYVRNINNSKKVNSINIEVYEEMAKKELKKIFLSALNKWDLIDCIIIHRYGKLMINEKIVLVSCFSKHRKDSFESCNFIMDYLKKDAPFWKKEFYKDEQAWINNSN
tara:strand:- start:15885 stop:16301 length:417 start_codon:yes stop_codon:yes gene_type:complete